METFPKNNPGFEIPPAEKTAGGIRAERIAQQAAREFQFIADRLAETKKNGARYAVVGGAALAAWSKTDYEVLRENQTVRDLDVIVLDDPQEEIASLNALVQKRRRQNDFLMPVDFNTAKEPEYRSGAQLLTHFKKGRDGHYLVFRDIEKKLPDELLETRRASLKIGGAAVNFETFEPEVLLHLYIQRVGSLKAKDKEKVTQFLRHLRAENTDRPDHSRYQVFHDFARELRAKYPKYSAAMKIYNALDCFVFNSLVSHKFIPERIFKFLINL